MKRVIHFDSSLNTFRGPIVDWCKSLRNSTICEIKLLSNSGSPDPAPLSVVVSLQDGSMYRLQRAVKWVKKQIMPNVQDTIEKVSAQDIDLISQPLVVIKFKPGYYPSLLAILQVCRGIQKHGLIFKAPHIVMDCSDTFFALALVLNVTRNSLPRRSVVDTSQPTPCSALEDFWQNIYQSLQSQGYAFWENTIAEHTRGLARELLYRLARYKVQQLLESKLPQNKGSSVAASTVARIEALVENKELVDPTMWDKAWDARWKVVWKRLGPVAHPHGNGRMQSIANITGNINIISAPVDGCAPGRTAGRAPVQLLPTESSSVLLSVIMAGSYGKYLRIPQHSPNETSKKQDESQDPDSTTNKHHALNEITTSYIHRVPVDERYNCAVNWLGNSLPLESNTYQVWATPRECAIESAWAAAWSAAETRGAATSKSVLAVENSGDGPQTYTLAGARPRARTSVHPGVLGAISVTKSVTRIAIRASQRLSISFNREHSQESPGMASSHAGDSMEASRRSLQNQSPLGAVAPSSEVNSLPLDIPHTSTRQKLLSEIETSSPLALYPQAEGSTLPSRIPRVRKSSGASSKQRKSDALTAGLHPISEASSRVDLSTPNPTVGSAGGILEPFPANAPVQMIAQKSLDSSVLSSGRTSPRPRSESATRRLRKHVITRWSDSQRYSEFEDAFVDKTQERKYREKKERSCAQAVQHMLSPTVFEEKLREANPTQQAQEAWDRAASLSGKTTFERKLKGLAQQEWEKIVDHRKRNSLTPLGDQPNDWENQFISAWERAWKESWAAAWAEVWRQSYKEAILRGVEFGVEEIFDDLDPKPKRRTYESLESSRPYSKLRESLLDNKSSLGSLEQIHQWMKELSYLSESLQYSVPTLRDECMEITVIKDKPKAPSGLMGRLGTTEVKTEPVRMSHYDLQEWLAEVYIFQKVHRDKQVYNLFLRGIAEVWDSVSEISSL